MIECPMPQDILKYKSKFVANFSVREVTCAALGVGAGLLCYFSWTKNIESQDLRMFFSFLTILPFFAVGFMKLYDQPFEKIVPTLLLDNFISPPKKKKEIHYPQFEKYENTRYWQLDELNLELVEDEESETSSKKKKHPSKKKNNSQPKKIQVTKSAVYKGIR